MIFSAEILVDDVEDVFIMTPNLDFSRLTREKLDVKKGMDLFLGHDFLSDPSQEFKLAKNSIHVLVHASLVTSTVDTILTC